MEYRILGPLEVHDDGRPVHVGGPQRRAVLAALLLDANRTVSVEHLVGVLWEHDPPAAARSLVHGCIARLRRVLGTAPDGPLLTRPPGYQLRVGPAELDLDRFDRLVAAAREHTGATAAAMLREALGLWRGPALADIDLAGVRASAVSLDERMLAVLEERIDADLGSGRHDGLVGELSALVHRHPLRERFWAQLILARCAAQRPAEALAAYRELRRSLIDQLGIEPSGRLRRMERAILCDEDVWAVYRADLPGAPGTAPRSHPPESTLPEPAGPGPAVPAAGSAQPAGSRAAPALLGRAVEVRALRAALDAAATGPVLLGVAGDPGIGKTRLLDDLADRARHRGRLVLTGQGAEFERDVPFGVFRNALDDHLAGGGPAGLDRLAEEERRLLPAAFPTLGTAGAANPAATMVAAERYRLHRAIRTLLSVAAEPAGLVLVLDDLHWCDEGSAELLAHLLRHPPTAPVLLAFAYRPRQLATRVHREIVAAARRGTAAVLDVGPLSYAEATALLPPGLGDDARRRLYAAAEGNPFYLDVLSRRPAGHLADAPADEPPGLGTDVTALPEPVRAALAGEFATLPGTDQRVAHAAALISDGADAALVGVVAGVPHAETLAALDELERRDLLRAHGAGYRFRHPLVRSAAYQHARPGWRVAAHARAAGELARRGAPVTERAGHVALSAAPGDLDAVRLLQCAAVEAIHVVPSAAATWLDAALRLLPHQPDTADLRLQLLNAQATALGITGHLARSRDILTEVLRLVPPDSPQRVTVLGFLAMVTGLLGNHARAHALLEGELAGLADQRGTAAGSLRVAAMLGGILRGTADADEIRTAISVARDAGDRALLASALALGAVASRSFDVAGPDRAGWVDEAAGLVDAAPDAELAGRLDATLYLGWAEAYLERFATAARRVHRALDIARRTGQGHLMGPLRMLLGIVHCMTGDLPRATAALDDAMESAVLTGGEETRGRLLAYQAWVSVWTGDTAAAVDLAEESVTLASGGQGLDWQTGQAVSHLGFVRLAVGDPDGAIELMLRTGGGPELPAVRQVWRPFWLDTLSAAATAAGRCAEAHRYAAQAAALPAIDSLPRRAAVIRLARVYPLAVERPAEAAREAERAAVLFDRAGDRLGAARARFHAGLAYRAAGEAGRGEVLAGQARQGFAACGARTDWLAWARPDR